MSGVRDKKKCGVGLVVRLMTRTFALHFKRIWRDHNHSLSLLPSPFERHKQLGIYLLHLWTRNRSLLDKIYQPAMQFIEYVFFSAYNPLRSIMAFVGCFLFLGFFVIPE